MGKTVSMIGKGFRDFGRWWKDNHVDPFPAGADLRSYQARFLPDDLRAGLNVALLAFPQGLAYAAVAGLPIVYGVTCSAVAATLAPLFSSSRFTVLGPTNATAFMMFSFFAAQGDVDGWKWIPLVVLMAGLILVTGAFLRLADLVQYISRSVVVGYVVGAVVLICTNQLQHVLGLHLPPGKGTLLSVIGRTIETIPSTNLTSLGIALFTVVTYLFLARRLPRLPVFAVALLLASVLAAVLKSRGLDTPTYDSFGLKDLLPVRPDSVTAPEVLERVSRYFGLAVGLAFLAALENSVMAQTLAGRLKSGAMPDRNQDMFSVGVANVASFFLSGMAASGSLTRSALNVSSAAASRFASIFAGLLCLAGAFLLGDYVGYIPKASLAVLVVCIAASLINLRQIRIALRSTLSDATVLIATFLAALLLPLHVAIFVGVGVSVALYLRKASRPFLVEYDFDETGELSERFDKKREKANPAITIVHVEGELFFGAAELFRSQIYRTCQDPNLKVVVLRMKNAHHLDATSVMALETLVEFLREHDRHLIVSGCMLEVYRVLKNSGIVEIIGRDNIFPGSAQNPTLATRNALIRAQELIGDEKADIRIYYDPSKGEAK